MQLITDISNFPKHQQVAVTVGVFDGIHIAHRLLLDELKQQAKQRNAKSVVITFDNHPCKILNPEKYQNDFFLLHTLDEKIKMFEEIGIDYLVVLPFTKEFAKLSYTDFVENIVVEYIQPCLFLVGFNHNFGNNRKGNFETLHELSKKHHFDVEIFPEQTVEQHKISSTEIRTLIRSGKLEQAYKFLKNNYNPQSTIKKNIHQIGSQLPQTVKLVAVSKTKPIVDLLEIYSTGQRDFGENKVQELVDKFERLPKDIRWHFIGHLQTNKVKYIASFVHLIHSVDSLKLLKEINKEAGKNQRVVDCLLEFFIAKDETKFGLNLSEAKEILTSSDFRELQNIRICGVMGMATLTKNTEEIRQEFRQLNQIFQTLKREHFRDKAYFSELSMGMSDDYLQAIEEGSTMVRLGSILFESSN